MRTFGDDRCRPAGDKLILLSAISKGWTARVPKSATTSEHPGTAVLWDEQYFEVIDVASAGGDRVRYVLVPWREEHTMRVVEEYDEESEARRIADFELAKKQRRASAGARFSYLLLGHLPANVQERMENELGVAPVRMTMISCVPPMVFFGVCVFLTVDAIIAKTPSVIPTPLLLFGAFLMGESLFRLHATMATGRGIGSVLGLVIYSIYWRLSPARGRLAPPIQREEPLKVFTLPVAEDVALQDKITLRGPLLTLLSRGEQERLAERYGFNYREHAFGLTWLILVCATVGTVSAIVRIQSGAGVSTLIAMFVAGGVALEQILRLMTLQRGPAPSLLGALVRPFVRDLLA